MPTSGPGSYQAPRCPEALAGFSTTGRETPPVSLGAGGVVMLRPVLRPDVDALPSRSIAESSQVARLRREPRMARSLTDPLTSWDDARDTHFLDWLFGQVIGLVEEVTQGGDDQAGCFSGQDVLSTRPALTSIDATSAPC